MEISAARSWDEQRPISVLLVSLFCLALPLHGQHYAFQTYSEESGLGNLSVQAMLQDQKGFIWVGSQNGLYRYEGLRFRAFDRHQGLPDTMISALHQTTDGVLWVGTRSGLFRFDGDHFIPAAHAMPWEVRWQCTMASDSGDRLLVATTRGLLIGEKARSSANARNFHLYTNPKLPPGQSATAVAVDSHDVVWFSYGTSLYQLHGNVLTDVGTKHGLYREAWKSIVVARDAKVWLRSPQHLVYWDSMRDRFVEAGRGIPTGDSRSYLGQDGQGRIVVPTNRGLGRWVDGRWTFLTASNGLPGDSVCCVLTDHESSEWIGMRGTGLVRSRTLDQWESWGRAEGLHSEEIWSVQRDVHGRLWVGTSGGLDLLKTGTTDQLRSSPTTQEHVLISSFAESSNGFLWAGTATGRVLRIDLQSGAVHTFGAESGLSGSNMLSILSLMVDRAGQLWVSTTEGLFVSAINVPAFKRVEVSPGTESDMFHQCVEDRSGAIWAASSHGLARLRNGHWTIFRKSDGLAGDHVTGVATQSNGDVWISYAQTPGTSRLHFEADKQPQVEHFSRSNQLHSGRVVALAVDSRDWVWMSGDNGVDVFAAGKWLYFRRAQGLVWNDCNSNALYADKDGSVWVGTSKGLAHYTPLPYMQPNPAPPVVLTAAHFGTRSILHDVPSMPFQRAPLILAFTALTFNDEPAVRFRYRLTGLETEWVETDARQLRYPDLHPGNFVFEVYGRSADNIWSQAPARLSFSIRPPFWQTWWFELLEATTLFALAHALWRWRTAHLHRRQRELEIAVQERTRELDAERKKFESLATWDTVTGIWNRRAISELLANELARAKRASSSVALIMLDLDYFKRINDTYGHQAGDDVLRQAALRMKSCVRISDGVGRYGGEEFVIILPDCDAAVALTRAEQIRATIASKPMSTAVGNVAVTCSLGVTATSISSYVLSSLISDADAALYRAKHAGRNRVEIAFAQLSCTEAQISQQPDNRSDLARPLLAESNLVSPSCK